MKIEELSLGVKKEKVIRKRGFGRRRPRKRVQAESGPIQGLFDLSREIFMGPGTVPPPEDVRTMRSYLGKDFGF